MAEHASGRVHARDRLAVRCRKAQRDASGSELEPARDALQQIVEAFARDRRNGYRPRPRRDHRAQPLGIRAVGLVEHEQRRPLARADLLEHAVDGRLALLDPVRARVHDVQQQVGLDHLLERRAKRGDQRVRQLAHEAHGVDQHQLAPRPQLYLAHERVERHEELVRHRSAAARERVEQRGLSGVGVAHQGHHRRLAPRARLAPGQALAADVLDLATHRLDPLPDPAAVRLQLRLAGPAGSDPAAEPRQQHAAPRQPRQQVVELRQLDLEPALARARPAREDVEDQLRAVERLALDLLLQVALLGRRELLVEEHQLGLLQGAARLHLAHLAAADECRGVAPRPLLQLLADDARAGALRELVERGFAARAVARSLRQSDEQRALPRTALRARCDGRGLPEPLQARVTEAISLTRVMRAFATRWCRSPSRRFRNAPGRLSRSSTRE